MLIEKRLFDDVARVASGAAGALGGLRSRFEGELRDQVERLMLRMNLVAREEFDAMAAVAQAARAEQEKLSERLAVLEAAILAAKPARSTPKAAKPASKPRVRQKTAPKPAPGRLQRPES
jgi:BMFP domain-containing protein YqiC